MIYDDWVIDFVTNYKKEVKLEVLVKEISHSLQFNDTPSFELIKSGEVDCVAAAAITTSILKSFFLDYRFEVVLLPSLPWINGVKDSKHCAVVQFEKGVPIFIIDPTPINGYGYGKISKRLKLLEWQKIENGWKLKKQPEISKCKFWEDHLYAEILLMTQDDIQKILEINNARYSIKNDIKINLKCSSPKNSLGWIKEYWRTKAQLATLNKKVREAVKCYQKALEVSPNNPYLLEEVISFCQKNKLNNYFSTDLLEKNKELVIKKLIRCHEKAIRIWNNKKEKCLSDENWESYLYYLGNIFWRKQSISLLKNEVLDEIPVIQTNKDFLKIYRLSPAWFKNNRAGILISKNRINKKNILFQVSFIINASDEIFCNKFLKIGIKKGYINIVNKNFIPTKNVIYNELLAHRQLLGLIKKELIIL